MNVSRKIYTDLDLQGNCLLSFRLPIYDEEPELIVGSIYYNPLIKEVYFGYEDGWQPFGTGVGDVVLGNYVDLTSSQIISGNKIFEGGLQTAALYISDSGHSIYDDSDVLVIQSVADMMVLATGHAIDMYGDIFKFNDSDVITSAGGIITGLTQFLATVNLEGRLDFHQGVIASLGPVDGKFAITTDSLTITGFTEIDEGLTVRGVGITTGGITLSASDVSHNIFDDGGDLAIETDYAIVLSGNGLTYNGYDIIHEGNGPSYMSKFTYSKSEINDLISALDKLSVSDGSTAVLASGPLSDIVVGIYGKTNISGSLHVLSGIFNVTESILTYNGYDIIHKGNGPSYMSQYTYSKSEIDNLISGLGQDTPSALDKLLVSDGSTAVLASGTSSDIVVGIYGKTNISGSLHVLSGIFNVTDSILTYKGYTVIHTGNAITYLTQYTYSRNEIDDIISNLSK